MIIDVKKIVPKVNKAKKKALFALGTQVLEDSNFYCKWDTKTLINSSLVNSGLNLTTVQWVTPYAHKQYYLPNAHKDKNPHATCKWFETAKANHMREWQIVFDNAQKGGM